MGRLLGNGPLSARLGWRQSECATDLAHDLIRPAQKIGCCVAQQPNTRVGKAVLATVVINQSIAVGSAVVLDTESVGGVIKVGPAEEATELVVHLHLHLRSRQQRAGCMGVVRLRTRPGPFAGKVPIRAACVGPVAGKRSIPLGRAATDAV